jgi:hypothetical protein
MEADTGIGVGAEPTSEWKPNPRETKGRYVTPPGRTGRYGNHDDSPQRTLTSLHYLKLL